MCFAELDMERRLAVIIIVVTITVIGQVQVIWGSKYTPGDRGSTAVKVLCYKSEGRWFDPSWCHWIFR